MCRQLALWTFFSATVAFGQEGLEPVRFLAGQWTTASKGQPGEGRGERTYAAVLGGRFIEGRNKVFYPPTEKSKGETHEDLTLFSFDKTRGKIVLRQFHSEGFVNQYVCTPLQGAVVCESEAIENIAAGWRARLTWRPSADAEYSEMFELAAPGKDYSVYTLTSLKKR